MAICVYFSRKYANPYTLTFIFGKKGAGKSCWMTALMIKYMLRGYKIYTDMHDINIQGVRIVQASDFSTFRPEPNSAIFLDEVGITMDNRNFKSFPPGLRDFFKYVRKNKCVVFMNSQSFDVDKKVRDTTDSMALVVSIFGFLSLYRPIKRVITLVDASSNGESRIADNLRFCSIFSWRILFMPHYFKFFNSLEMPSRDYIPYTLPSSALIPSDFHFLFLFKEAIYHVTRRVESYFRD